MNRTQTKTAWLAAALVVAAFGLTGCTSNDAGGAADALAAFGGQRSSGSYGTPSIPTWHGTKTGNTRNIRPAPEYGTPSVSTWHGNKTGNTRNIRPPATRNARPPATRNPR